MGQPSEVFIPASLFWQSIILASQSNHHVILGLPSTFDVSHRQLGRVPNRQAGCRTSGLAGRTHNWRDVKGMTGDSSCRRCRAGKEDVAFNASSCRAGKRVRSIAEWECIEFRESWYQPGRACPSAQILLQRDWSELHAV